MTFLYSILAAIVAFSGTLMIDGFWRRSRSKNQMRVRLAQDGSDMSAEYAEGSFTLGGELSTGAKTLQALLRGLGVNVDQAMHHLNRRFAQAGIRSPDAPTYYLLLQRIGSVVFVAIAGLIALAADSETALESYALALLIAGLGIFGPKLYIQNMIDRRKKVLQRAFPDTLDLLLICVESGLALDASLNRVCTELGKAYPEMTAELNRTRLDLALLNDRVRALMNLGERTDMVAFRSLISALIQSERFGTSLTDTLRVLSEEFRLQRLTDAEVKAARLPVMMTIPLMLFLMPALFLIILGPAIVSVVHNGQEVTGKKK